MGGQVAIVLNHLQGAGKAEAASVREERHASFLTHGKLAAAERQVAHDLNTAPAGEARLEELIGGWWQWREGRDRRRRRRRRQGRRRRRRTYVAAPAAVATARADPQQARPQQTPWESPWPRNRQQTPRNRRARPFHHADAPFFKMDGQDERQREQRAARGGRAPGHVRAFCLGLGAGVAVSADRSLSSEPRGPPHGGLARTKGRGDTPRF